MERHPGATHPIDRKKLPPPVHRRTGAWYTAPSLDDLGRSRCGLFDDDHPEKASRIGLWDVLAASNYIADGASVTATAYVITQLY